MNEHPLAILGEALFADPVVSSYARIGLCRIWTREAISFAKRYRETTHVEFRLEAREIDIEPGLSHTFLRALAGGGESYVYDGSGTGWFPPYWGEESTAPHLAESHLDYLQKLLLDDE